MKVEAISFLIIGIFIVASYFLHKYMCKIKSVIWFLAIILIYIVLLYVYFDLILKTHYYLRDRGIYIDFGHASILLFLLAIICLILAIINIVWAAVSRFRNLQIKNPTHTHT